MKRSEIRELAFKLIYSLEIQKPEDLEEQVELYLECNEVEENEAKEYIKDAIFGIKQNVNEIQGLIEKNLKADWKIDRISKLYINLNASSLIADLFIFQTPFFYSLSIKFFILSFTSSLFC